MRLSKQHIATFLALLFHVSGAIGILCTPYKDWFIRHTPFTICLMSALLIWTHEGKNFFFYFFFAIAFLTGMGAEMIGVHTGRLFGAYAYGHILGPAFNGVPWLIGLNWFAVVFCASAVIQQLHVWMVRKLEGGDRPFPHRIKVLSLWVDGALLAVFFDWIMEPAAVKLGYWQWRNGEVPAYNYACWFFISLALLVILRWMRFPKANHFAVHLFIIQALFFLALRTYLV